MYRFLSRAPLAILLAVASTLVGCGGGSMKTAVVKGKVTYKGKPIPNGTITFIPNGQGPSATGELQKDGSYRLTTYRKGDGAVLGQYKVIVVALQDTSNKLPEERNPLPASLVPNKYTSAATSDLSAEVKDGENICDFELGDPNSRSK